MSRDGAVKATNSDTCPPCTTAVSPSRRLSRVASITLALVLTGLAHGADVAVHSSNRYYQDSTGKPLVLIGYYAWAAVVDGYTIDHASSYSGMMNQGSPFKMSETPPRVKWSLKPIGSDNEAIYSRLCGLTAEEIKQLESDEVI